MRVNVQETELETNIDDDQTEFTIRGDAFAFNVLSKQIYSNPLAAAIREVMCNAYDGHVMAGKPDEPIEVHLPTYLEPWFSVRDNGIGMSFDTVRGLYTTYFASTKRTSDSATGGFGIGSKAPFAYTDQFTVEARWEGKIKTFVFFKKNGIPKVMSMSEETDTDEPNGIAVTFSVDESDVSNFQGTFSEVAEAFRIRPITNITIDIRNIFNPDGGMSGTNWSTIPNSCGGSIYVVQANVKYEAPNDMTPPSGVDVFLHAEPGTFTPAPSREQLSLADGENDVLKGMWGVFEEEYSKDLQDNLDNCETIYDAISHINAHREMYKEGMYRYREWMWKGKKVKSVLRFEHNDYIKAFKVNNTISPRGEWCDAVGQASIEHEHNNNIQFVISTKEEFSSRKTRRKMKAHRETLYHSTRTYIVVYNPDHVNSNDVLDYLYNPPEDWIIQYADLPEPPKAEKLEVNVYKIRGNQLIGSGRTNSLTRTDVDPNEATGYWIPMEQFSWIDEREATLLQVALESGIVRCYNTTIFAVPKTHIKRFEDSGLPRVNVLIKELLDKVDSNENKIFITAYLDFQELAKGLNLEVGVSIQNPLRNCKVHWTHFIEFIKNSNAYTMRHSPILDILVRVYYRWKRCEKTTTITKNHLDFFVSAMQYDKSKLVGDALGKPVSNSKIVREWFHKFRNQGRYAYSGKLDPGYTHEVLAYITSIEKSKVKK